MLFPKGESFSGFKFLHTLPGHREFVPVLLEMSGKLKKCLTWSSGLQDKMSSTVTVSEKEAPKKRKKSKRLSIFEWKWPVNTEKCAAMHSRFARHIVFYLWVLRMAGGPADCPPCSTLQLQPSSPAGWRSLSTACAGFPTPLDRLSL